jgi:hypothetical protein
MRTKLALALIVAGTTATACRRAERPHAAEPVDAFFAQQRLTRSQAWGRHVFTLHCAVCQGAMGHGDGKNAYTLEPLPPDFSTALNAHPPAYWRQIITDGSASVGRSPLCPPHGRILGTYDVDGLVAYLDVLAKSPEPQRRRR